MPELTFTSGLFQSFGFGSFWRLDIDLYVGMMLRGMRIIDAINAGVFLISISSKKKYIRCNN